MNQTQTIERLRDLDRAAHQFAQASQAQQEAASLRSSLVVAAQAEQRRAVAAQTLEAGGAAVVEAKADLASWRARFKVWVATGHQLAGELAGIEKLLYRALANVVGGQRQALGQAGNEEEMARLDGETERLSLDRFRELGALDPDLAPFPSNPGNAWASAMIEAMGAAAGGQGEVYDPRAGLRQFKHTTGAY